VLNCKLAIGKSVSKGLKIYTRVCPFCGNAKTKEIPWEEKFNKFPEGKESATKPQAYKCDKCGKEFIRYTYF
jgi:predicted RNA-binding Zn-ribbon protein involved in translation (DUF1610 family)